MLSVLLLAVAATTTTALEVAVVSLTPPTASEHYGAAGRAWRWKVAVMGEDMALPRPKTALALAESIVERSGGAVQEAATLSTCARLLLIVAGNEDAVSATRASLHPLHIASWRQGACIACARSYGAHSATHSAPHNTRTPCGSSTSCSCSSEPPPVSYTHLTLPTIYSV